MTVLPEPRKVSQRNDCIKVIVKLSEDLQGLLIVFFSLLPLLLLLGHAAQVVIGAGLAVAGVVLDLDLQGLLVVLLGL